jgi:hypothetical protein
MNPTRRRAGWPRWLGLIWRTADLLQQVVAEPAAPFNLAVAPHRGEAANIGNDKSDLYVTLFTPAFSEIDDPGTKKRYRSADSHSLQSGDVFEVGDIEVRNCNENGI